MKAETRVTVLRTLKACLTSNEMMLRNALEFPTESPGYEISNQIYRDEIRDLKAAIEDLEEVRCHLIPDPEGEIVKAAVRGSDGGNLVASDPDALENIDDPDPRTSVLVPNLMPGDEVRFRVPETGGTMGIKIYILGKQRVSDARERIRVLRNREYCELYEIAGRATLDGNFTLPELQDIVAVMRAEEGD